MLETKELRVKRLEIYRDEVLLKYNQNDGVGFTAWEQDFIENLSNFWELSHKQEEVLERLFEKACLL